MRRRQQAEGPRVQGVGSLGLGEPGEYGGAPQACIWGTNVRTSTRARSPAGARSERVWIPMPALPVPHTTGASLRARHTSPCQLPLPSSRLIPLFVITYLLEI